MIKKIFLMVLSLMTLVLSGCDKVPMNGDLDGMWQLMEIQNEDGVKDMKSQRLYCSFQLHMIMLGHPSHPQHYFGYFEHKGGKLRFYSFTYRSEYQEGNNYDRPMNDDEDLAIIAPWGFYSTDCTFDVEKLNKSELILRKDETVIKYRKF